MSGSVGAPWPSASSADRVTQDSLRDLMGLLALPALWLGRDADTVMRLTTEAIARVAPLDMSHIQLATMDTRSAAERFTLGERVATAAERAAWDPCLRSLLHLPIGAAPRTVASPLGELRVVRLSMGYSARSGSFWFGSRDPAFPSVPHSAFLRAAATLAATGLQAAALDMERATASRAKDEFLAMLGHELRNPLAPIFTALEIIKRETGAPLSRAHAIIERQSRHLSRLVDDLLDVSRIATGKIELDRQPVALRTVLSDAVEATAPLMAQRDHALAIQLPPESVQLVGDRTRLVQVFANLLNNAAKYTPSGGRIELGTHTEGTWTAVTVDDNGTGIPSDLMPRLFDIFEQGRSTLDRAGGGLGIGLALVRNFVELHGGTVHAASEGVGRGARFTVRLPLAAGTAPALALPDPAVVVAPPAALKRRVLLVDDNLDALETLADVLASSGFEVATAADPDAALAAHARFGADVAVLDIGLPGIGGHGLAAALRETGAPPRLISLSGYGQADDHLRSLRAGFERHLVKPVAIEHLLTVLRAG